MKMKICLFLVLLLASLSSGAQDIEYAKSIVATLAAPEMKGRGYVEGGDQLAAQFIQSEFEKAGLKRFKKSYFQNYTTPVNSFPGKMGVKINGLDLIPGKDFLIDAGSPSVKGVYKTVNLHVADILDPARLRNRLRGSESKFIVLEAYNAVDYKKEELERVKDFVNYLKYSPENISAGSIFLTTAKLTWGGSTSQNKKASFTVKVDSAAAEIEQVEFDVEAVFIEKHKSQNVVAYVEGEKKDSFVVLVAHYDHLGMMGSSACFPGANDNASGVSMLLSLAKYYSVHKPKYTIVFIAFGGEEIGLVGAKYFVENPVIDLKKIKFLLNFDLAGTGDDGIQVVNGSVHQDKFDLLTEINNENKLLKEVRIRGEACNSDHCMFHMKKVPCFFIYTLGGIQAYHDIYDIAETLPLTEFEDYFKLMTMFIQKL